MNSTEVEILQIQEAGKVVGELIGLIHKIPRRHVTSKILNMARENAIQAEDRLWSARDRLLDAQEPASDADGQKDE